MWAKLALKLFSREFRRGELTVISAAIALAVLTVLTLSMVTERIAQSIAQKSSAFIAADRVLASNHAIDTAYITQANEQWRSYREFFSEHRKHRAVVPWSSPGSLKQYP